jgi:hypothetical protein
VDDHNCFFIALQNLIPALVIVWVSLERSIDVDPTADSLKPR